jgi:hypothetical protein
LQLWHHNSCLVFALPACRDLEIQLKTEQVHIAPASNKLASHRTTGAYRNYGERLYVEGRLDALKREQLVGWEVRSCLAWVGSCVDAVA